MKKLKLIHLSSGNNVSYLKTSRLLLSVLLSFTFCLLSSQVPKGFNYQAVARDGVTGNPITDPIDLRFTIRSDSLAGTVFWVEEHYGVDPDDNGLFNVVVGRGTRTSGVAKFADIDWTVTPKFLMTHINDGAWNLMGSSRLWTVPYALVADSLGGPLAKLSVKGSVANLEDALFEVKNSSGQTVFAVYNEGVRIYVDDGSKSPKGGFAVSGFGNEKDAFSDRYLYVSRDSVRVYLDSNPDTKAPKGGFAVTGWDFAKGLQQNFLDVNGDSVRIYIDNSSKAYKGSFAVTGFSGAKGITPKYLKIDPAETNISVSDSLKGFSITNIQGTANSDFMNINKVNYSIGHESGLKTVPNFSSYLGRYNVFFGYKSGFNNLTGYGNIFTGHESGYFNSSGSYNVYIGYMSGKSNSVGYSNLFMGYQSGFSSTANYNVYLGQGSGQYNAAGERNTYVGTQSGIEDGKYAANPLYPPGNDNVFIGYRSGAKHWRGNNNTYVGVNTAGDKFGTGRVFIGYMAGYSETTDNKLYIENSSIASPLIWGDFNADDVKINGDLEVTGTFTNPSDSRLKRDIEVLKLDLNAIMNLNPVTFYWKQGVIPDLTMSESQQIGLVAQDVEKIFPALVVTGTSGYKSIEYSKLSLLMIPAIKDLYDQLKNKDSELDELKKELAELKELILTMKNTNNQ